MRRTLRVLYPLLLVVGLLVCTAAPASAAFGIGDCKEAPVAQAPNRGISGFFASDTPPPEDPKGGAWANGAPLYEHYGQAGLRFHNYDLGCGADIFRDPGAVIGTMVGNWMMLVPKFVVAGTGALLGAAYEPTFLQALDPLLTDVTEALRSSVFDTWLPVSLAVIGILFLWRSRDGSWSRTGAAVGWALMVMVVATAVFAWPQKAGGIADETVTEVVGTINTSVGGQNAAPATAAAGALSNVVLFNTWKLGTFGSTNSPTAQKYARDLYTSQALTHAEAAVVAADPEGRGKELLDAKAEKWEATAERIKAEDPDAYAYLTGTNDEGRPVAAAVAMFAALCLTPFLLAAALMLLGSFLILRLAVVFLPAIAVIGIVWEGRKAVTGMFTVCLAAVANAVLFGLGAAVTIRVVSILFAPGAQIPGWLAVILMGVISFIMWVALKPFRKLTAMASPAVFKSAAGAAGDTAAAARDHTVSFAKTAAAAYLGNRAALAKELGGGDETEEETEEQAPRPESTTLPEPEPQALPASNLLVGNLPAPVETDSPAPTGEPEPEPRHRGAEPTEIPAPTSVGNLPAADDLPTTAPEEEHAGQGFTPGPVSADAPSEPALAERQIDTETGEEVYVVFRPEDEGAER